MKGYVTQSFASDTMYLVVQISPRSSQSGQRYLHMQIPGPPANRDYGLCVDLEVNNNDIWEEIVKMAEKAGANVFTALPENPDELFEAPDELFEAPNETDVSEVLNKIDELKKVFDEIDGLISIPLIDEQEYSGVEDYTEEEKEEEDD